MRSENAAEPVLSAGEGKFRAAPAFMLLSVPDVSSSDEASTPEIDTDPILPPPIAPRPSTKKLQKARHRIYASSGDETSSSGPIAAFERGVEERGLPRSSPFAMFSANQSPKAKKGAKQKDILSIPTLRHYRIQLPFYLLPRLQAARKSIFRYFCTSHSRLPDRSTESSRQRRTHDDSSLV
ncbi:hypothetical protein BC829DRAFT_255213 [Chytridium lagenaria]|nr:hypothetical protein BC829DRAFT_255213 [Chytridium lagenaria]